MWITETATQAGVNAQTLRYYERRGLLPKPRRRGSYREYSGDAVRTVRFIKRAQQLGFALGEVGELMKLRNVGRGDRQRVRAIAERRIQEIDRKLAQLEAMRTALNRLVESCRHGGVADCPIIEALSGD
jgi:DNA-binding transcriptional MerR regulator